MRKTEYQTAGRKRGEMMNDLKGYCKIMIALYKSGDEESIDIYYKIQKHAREKALYAQHEDDYVQLCDENRDADFAKELGVSTESLKKAFRLFMQIGLVELCTDKELEEMGE